MHGIATLGFAAEPPGGRSATRLIDLEQRAPLRVLFPHEPESGVLQAVLVTMGGGLLGGDVHDIAVSAGERTGVLLTTQAAEKVYRSTGADSRINLTLRAADDSWVEWMPQETILFDGCRLDRRTTIDLAAGARFFGGEILIFGRTARGESLTRGFLRDAWRIHVAGRLVWADALILDGTGTLPLAATAGFDQAVAATTLVYAGEDALQRIDSVRSMLSGLETATDGSGLRLAATCVNGILVIRGLARDARRLRTAVTGVWQAFRALVAHLPPQVPRIWVS